MGWMMDPKCEGTFCRQLTRYLPQIIVVAMACWSAGCGTRVVSVSATPSNWRQEQPFSAAHWKKFPAPQPGEIDQSLTLYGTYYFTPVHQYTASGIPVLDRAGAALGPRLSKTAFCEAGDEGAFRAPVSQNGRAATFNIAGVAGDAESQADCTRVFAAKLEGYARGLETRNWPSIVAGFQRARYRATDAPYGNANTRWWLVPWRTLATDNMKIPPGTVLFIPQAVGVRVLLPSGDTVRHDGYFFAADSGSDIRDSHIDFFTGLLNPETHIAFIPGIDGRNNTFTVHVVTRGDITAYFKGLHHME